MNGKYNMLLVLFTIQLKLAWAGFSCHSSINENGSGSFTVTGDQECNDYSFKDDHGNVLKIGHFVKGQAVYEFLEDVGPNITFFCNMPSRGDAVCKREMSGEHHTADGSDLSASIIVVIVLGVIVLIILVSAVIIVVRKKAGDASSAGIPVYNRNFTKSTTLKKP